MKRKTQQLLSIMATMACLSLPLRVECAENKTQVALEAVENCPTLISEFRQTAIEQMEKKIEASLQNAIQWGFCGQYYMMDDINYGPVSVSRQRRNGF